MAAFIKTLKENSFDIDDVFYSTFSNSMLLKGFAGKNKIELLISEITNINLQFVNSD